MAKLIIHTNTRIIFCMTSDPNPSIDSKQSTVTVADNFALLPNKKLDVDNVTLLDPTAQNLSDLKDDYDSSRNEVRELKDAGTALFTSAQTLGNSNGSLSAAQVRAMASDLKTFMVKLNNWVKAPT